ncbi:MAG: hypothetical protein CFH08_02295 [Alphaproteobacteria bacterium MarineAlpha3_Bin7]|nr:MAG: hypothetical protein CFH08_02295 [Alphaproteobacteria bacterium MarineAlpha3_Bin7]
MRPGLCFFALILASTVALGSSLVGAADISSDTTISSANTNTQQNFTANNVTLTINADTTGRTNNGISVDGGISGATVIVGSGVTVSVTNNQAIDGTGSTNLTVTNSGILSAVAKTIELEGSASGAVITNNFGGTITAANNTIKTQNNSSNITVNNSGVISTTSIGHAIATATGTDSGMVINNFSTGQILKTSTADAAQETIELGDSGTITNSGQIRNDTSPSNTSIRLKGDNSTVILQDGGIVVGRIISEGTGNKLQVNHGLGQAYFYDTAGTLELEDLAGNTIVEGSASAVGLGAQETVDELLALKASNLRAALKRYTISMGAERGGSTWGETFGFSSNRSGTTKLQKYQASGFGVNVARPVTLSSDLLLSLENSNLGLQGNHDVARKAVFVGLNISENIEVKTDRFSASGFIVGGVGWNDSHRQVLTNTTASGFLDLHTSYRSYEAIASGNIGYNIDFLGAVSDGELSKNSFYTELGFTLAGVHIGDYNEGNLFFWDERSLIQESIYLREEISHKLGKNSALKLGAEVEHRKVLIGAKQKYKINSTDVSFSNGRNSELLMSANFDVNHKIPHGLAYFQIQQRFSRDQQGFLGGGIGVKFKF